MTQEIPEEFCKVMKDFVKDIQSTFPEYVPLIQKWWNEEDFNTLFTFVQKKYPPRFFDILYQNVEIFEESTNVDTEFLPNIHFKNLWQFDLTDKNRETIWKYLQLILFSVTNTIKDKTAFGDMSKVFEEINQEDFKNKLEETLEKIQEVFSKSEGEKEGEGEGEGEGEKEGKSDSFEKSTKFGKNINMENIPNAEQLHSHITGMLDGKLGQLAKEIAEETAGNLNMDMENVTDMKDVFANLMKNPDKLMGLVKNVGDKLETKMKSGDINESELISEATQIMNKMKSMPGMEGIQEMLSKMGMSGLGGGLNKKASRPRELRVKNRVEMPILKENSIKEMTKAMTEEELIKLFQSSEKPEKTPRVLWENNEKKEKKDKKDKKNKKVKK